METAKDLSNCLYENHEKIIADWKNGVPENYSGIVRQAIRDLFSEPKRVPSIGRLYDKIPKLKVQDVMRLNISYQADRPF